MASLNKCLQKLAAKICNKLSCGFQAQIKIWSQWMVAKIWMFMPPLINTILMLSVQNLSRNMSLKWKIELQWRFCRLTSTNTRIKLQFLVESVFLFYLVVCVVLFVSLVFDLCLVYPNDTSVTGFSLFLFTELCTFISCISYPRNSNNSCPDISHTVNWLIPCHCDKIKLTN